MTVAGLGAGYGMSGVVQKLGIANWGIDRSIRDLKNEYLDESDYTGALAESWEISPDLLSYTFNIRNDVSWHNKAPMNGRALTASDVAYNFHRLLGIGSGFTEPPLQTSILLNFAIESVTAPDDNTVVFELEKPQFTILVPILDDSYVFIYPPEVIMEHGDTNDWKNLVGTGALQLVEWVEGDSTTWEKNPDYWGYDEKYPTNRLPYIDRLRALHITDRHPNRRAARRKGRLPRTQRRFHHHLD